MRFFVITSLHIVLLNRIILELLVCGWCWCGMDPSCPNTHSRLILSLPITVLVELFIDAFTFYSRVLFGLAALVQVLGLGFSAAHMRACCYKVNYHTHSEISFTYIHCFNHIDHITSEDRMDLPFLTPSVGNNFVKIIGSFFGKVTYQTFYIYLEWSPVFFPADYLSQQLIRQFADFTSKC